MKKVIFTILMISVLSPLFAVDDNPKWEYPKAPNQWSFDATIIIERIILLANEEIIVEGIMNDPQQRKIFANLTKTQYASILYIKAQGKDRFRAKMEFREKNEEIERQRITLHAVYE